MNLSFLHQKAALVVAHPGHELSVYGWLESARPLSFVLTDGSGRSEISRVNSTSKILNAVGASTGSIYGRFTDREIYSAVLNQNFRFFEELVVELAEALVANEIDYVAGDAREGYNSVHDVCRLLIDAAVDLARHQSGRTIVNRDFLLCARQDSHPESLRPSAIWLRLDEETYARKLAVAKAYPELQPEVASALDEELSAPAVTEEDGHVRGLIGGKGVNAYLTECLRLVQSSAASNGVGPKPFYEEYGERLVAANVYQQTIRHREHMAPLANALRNFVQSKH